MEVGKRARGLARELPREARRLLREHVHSTGELDMLMLLHENRARGWSVEQVCTALRCPARPELERALQAIERAQRTRWTELTALIATPTGSRHRVLTEGTREA